MLLFILLLFGGQPSCGACGTLLLQPGVETVLPAMEAWSLNHWTTSSQDPVLTRNSRRVKLTTELSSDEPKYFFCFQADLVLSSEPSLCVVKSQRSQLKEIKGQVKWNCTGATDRGRSLELDDPQVVFTLVSEQWDPLLKQNVTRNFIYRETVCPWLTCVLIGRSWDISKGSLGHRKPVVQSNHLTSQVRN